MTITKKSKTKDFPDYLVVPKDMIKVSRNGFTDKFKTNKHAKQMKKENEKRALQKKEDELSEAMDRYLEQTMGTEESVEIARKGHFYWDVVDENPTPFKWKIEHTKVAIVFFALGILFAHVVFVMPLLNN